VQKTISQNIREKRKVTIAQIVHLSVKKMRNRLPSIGNVGIPYVVLITSQLSKIVVSFEMMLTQGALLSDGKK
jgi:hypothetical protein